MLCAISGILFTINYTTVDAYIGDTVATVAIAGMVLGGLGNVWGAVIGGLMVGILEVFSIYIVGADFREGADLGPPADHPDLQTDRSCSAIRQSARENSEMSGYLESQLIILCLSIIYAYGIFLPAASGQLNLGRRWFITLGAYASGWINSDGLGIPMPLSILLAMLFTGADQFRSPSRSCEPGASIWCLRHSPSPRSYRG